MGVPGTMGEHWSDAAWSERAPSHDDLARARQSEAARRAVDEQYVRWLGLPDDEAGPFLRHLAEFDVRERARVLEEANERLQAAEAQRARFSRRISPRLAVRL